MDVEQIATDTVRVNVVRGVKILRTIREIVAESHARINVMDALGNARGVAVEAAMVTLIELINNHNQLRVVSLCGRLSSNTCKNGK